ASSEARAGQTGSQPVSSGATALPTARRGRNGAAISRLSVSYVRVVVATAMLVAAACASVLGASPAAAVEVEPYGANDAGGFRNVLPAGENGLDNTTQLAEFEFNGT